MTQTNPKKYWFKRRRRTIGWTPVTWQGWATLVITVVVIPVLAIMQLPASHGHPSAGRLAAVIAIVAASLVVATVLCIKEGPPSR